MNRNKIIFLYIVGICCSSIFANSITYCNNYYSKRQYIEYKNNENKLRLSFNDNILQLTSLNIKSNDNLVVKKGKISTTTKLDNGFKSTIYVKYKYNNYEFFCNFPSLDGSKYKMCGVNCNLNNLTLKLSTFECFEKEKNIKKESFFNQLKDVSALKMGYITILDYNSRNLDITYEAVNTLLGYYFSSYLSFGFDNLKFFFEQQNLNYLYDVGVILNEGNLKLKINDYYYPQSSFSGKNSNKKYEFQTILNIPIDKLIFSGLSLKSIKFKVLEKIEIDEDLKYERLVDYYMTIYFITDNLYPINIRVGLENNNFLIEFEIDKFHFSYDNHGYKNIIDLVYKYNNYALNINCEIKKNFSIKLIYYY